MAETTWYDARGAATAYIAEDGTTVYTWKGKAVAYLVDGDKLYSWRGRHLGWYVDGIVYDGRAKRVGFTAATSPVAVAEEPVKPAPSKKPARAARTAARPRPPLTIGKSEYALSAFLAS